MNKNAKFTKPFLVVFLLFFVLVSLVACTGDSKTMDITKEEFFIPTDEGTYIHGEIVAPVSDDALPLVSMSHGIYGTMNSGGASELSERLAKSGIAAIRIDFNRCKTKNPAFALKKDKSGRTNDYTLSEMMESDRLAIQYAISNYKIDKDRIGLYGRSFGGRVAMLLGNESYGGFDYKAMALIAPAGNEYALIHYMGGQDSWDSIRKDADENGFYNRKGLKLTPKWFDDYYSLNPVLTGYKFGDKPVMVYYNTLDTIVEPKTSLECAHAYSNVEIHQVTTDDGHGYEMSFAQSEIKEEIMDRLVSFFKENL